MRNKTGAKRSSVKPIAFNGMCWNVQILLIQVRALISIILCVSFLFVKNLDDLTLGKSCSFHLPKFSFFRFLSVADLREAYNTATTFVFTAISAIIFILCCV